MADDLRADLDEFVIHARQRPVPDRFGRRQRTKEVAKIVSERVKLETNRVSAKRTGKTAALT
jgi:hypothetical protein